MNQKIGFILFILFVTTAGCSKFGKVLKSKDFEYKLKMANQYFDQKQYRQSQVLYEELFPIFKGTPQHEDLYYKFAYSHYHLKDFTTAEGLFKGYLEIFANSPRAEEVEYMQAYCFFRQSPKPELEQSNTLKAIGMFQIFVNTHPESARVKEAEQIIAKCQAKLEVKEQLSAQLYFNVGQFRAAALAFTTLMNNYPDSPKGDEYKLMSIRSYYRYAAMSIPEKQEERYNKVISEVEDFQDRFPESKLMKEAERFLTLTKNNLKSLNNEQTSQTSGK
ncbi:MAG: outer membrane protein assembly factor BamD [Chitinophagia bacterium]|jgi:outer membrane protein assembly factor BamD